MIECAECYLCSKKLNVGLFLECHSSIADDSPSLLRALVNLIPSRSHQKCSSDTYKMRPFKMKLCFTIFFSLTNLNLCVNSIPRVVKIHIRRRPGTQRKSRLKAHESGYFWNGVFFFYLNRPSGTCQKLAGGGGGNFKFGFGNEVTHPCNGIEIC